MARRSESSARKDGARPSDRLTYQALGREQAVRDTAFGVQLKLVADEQGKPLPHTVVDTMMRIDLPQPLAPGKAVTFRIDWSHAVIDGVRMGGRSRYEHFPESDTYTFSIAQFFPRMAAYTDYAGWQHKAFLGSGEFTLEFGDYDVRITVPSDHVVAATGELANAEQVLNPRQRERLAKARTADKPVFIVTPEEAAENEKTADAGTKTWHFKAKNVRDFAFASSNKFIWDAQGHRQEGTEQPLVMAMSFYPNEAEPLWSRYSTQAVIHTMEVYSAFSFPYPYPTAQSVNSWEGGGMEYPMITFNGGRPVIDKKTKERTYTAAAKYGLIGVIIHEIGHIYFPMVVNSDERQWTWMDEGLNSFLNYLANMKWEEEFGAHTGNPNRPDSIVDYMLSEDQVPIMTQSDSLLQFGANAYAKPTAALVILRETVMGRALLDHAFREYARRWRFKRPTPSDFFRTMEDVSGVDLDWFWRGWFYTTDHVDMAITDVREYQVSTRDPEVEKPLSRAEDARERVRPLTVERDRAEGLRTRVERDPSLRDFYNENDKFTVTNKERNDYASLLEGLKPWEREVLERAKRDGDFIYFVDFRNEGGLVMPLPLKLTFADGTSEYQMIPAEIWRRSSKAVTKMIVTRKQVVAIDLDPRHEIADADRTDNGFPRRIERSRIDLYKDKNETQNLMADMLVKLRAKDGEAAPDATPTVPLAPAAPPAPTPTAPAPPRP